MSQRPNHRRGEERHQDNGPTFRGDQSTPNSGCNSTSVAKARAWWKSFKNRTTRRTGKVSPKFAGGRPEVLPEIESEDG